MTSQAFLLKLASKKVQSLVNQFFLFYGFAHALSNFGLIRT